MKRQLQGIALILFGILLLFLAYLNPWVPIVEDVRVILLLLAFVSGVAGVIWSFGKSDH